MSMSLRSPPKLSITVDDHLHRSSFKWLEGWARPALKQGTVELRFEYDYSSGYGHTWVRESFELLVVEFGLEYLMDRIVFTGNARSVAYVQEIWANMPKKPSVFAISKRMVQNVTSIYDPVEDIWFDYFGVTILSSLIVAAVACAALALKSGAFVMGSVLLSSGVALTTPWIFRATKHIKNAIGTEWRRARAELVVLNRNKD